MYKEALIFDACFFIYSGRAQHDLNQLRENAPLLNADSSQKHGSPSPTLAHQDLTPHMDREMKIHPAECNRIVQPETTKSRVFTTSNVGVFTVKVGWLSCRVKTFSSE